MEKKTQIIERLERIEQLLTDKKFVIREVLNFNDACLYLDVSSSHLYKLTSAGSVPHYKPSGKKLYFKREELEKWLLRNKVNSQDEIEQMATNYINKKGKFSF